MKNNLALFLDADIYDTGGSIIKTLNVLKFLEKRNNIYLIYSNKNNQKRNLNLSKNIKLYPFFNFNKSYLINLYSPINSYFEGIKLKSEKIDCCHFNNCHDMGISSSILKKPYVVEIHGDLFYSYSQTKKQKHFIKDKLLHQFYLRSLKNSNVIITPDSSTIEFIYKNFSKIKFRKIKTVPNCINCSKIEKFDLHYNLRAKLNLNKKFIISYVARLATERNHLDILKALSIIIKKNTNIVLCLIGDGPEKLKIQQFIHHNSLSKNIFLLGNILNKYIPSIYSESNIVFNSFKPFFKKDLILSNSMKDILVNSYMLGCSTSTLEALAAKRLLICTMPNVRIRNPIFDDTEYGVLLPIEKSKLLAETILKSVKLDNTIENIIKNGYDYVIKNRDIDLMSDNLNSIYETIISNPQMKY